MPHVQSEGGVPGDLILMLILHLNMCLKNTNFLLVVVVFF